MLITICHKCGVAYNASDNFVCPTCYHDAQYFQYLCINCNKLIDVVVNKIEDGNKSASAVSYTHLTLPTIYSV